MCNAFEMSKEFAKEFEKECQEGNERVVASQRKEIARLIDKNDSLKRKSMEWEKATKIATIMATLEAGVILMLLCLVINLMT